MDHLDIDILGCSETHLKEHISACKYDRHILEHSPHLNNIQRQGIALIVKNEIADNIFKKVSGSIVILMLNIMGLNIVIIQAYAADTSYMGLDVINYLSLQSQVILTGDFNAKNSKFPQED